MTHFDEKATKWHNLTKKGSELYVCALGYQFREARIKLKGLSEKNAAVSDIFDTLSLRFAVTNSRTGLKRAQRFSLSAAD